MAAAEVSELTRQELMQKYIQLCVECSDLLNESDRMAAENEALKKKLADRLKQ